MIPFSDFNVKMLNKNIEYKTKRKKAKKGYTYIQYANISNSFDIETSNFYTDNKEKCAYCYIWQLCINGTYVYGRYLEEFVQLIKDICRYYNLSTNRRLVIYVHYLGFEFQFIRKYFEWGDIFARTERKPYYASTLQGIEFRDSLSLSGYKLEKVGELVGVQKLTDYFDYDKMRNSLTDLTETELLYCKHDIEILHEYIKKEIARNDNDITKIPLTRTGYIRRLAKLALQPNKDKDYNNMIYNAYPDTDLYILLKKVYQGGYTHANISKVDTVIDNVDTIDFNSSYPARMILNTFPQKFHKLVVDDVQLFRNMLQQFHCIFEISIQNIKAKYNITTISSSKCSAVEKVINDNGRVYKADYIHTYMCELDFFTFEKFYTYSDIKITNFYYSNKYKLPKPFINVILNLYTNKTELKGIDEKADEYMHSKEDLNSSYGMCVTSPICDDISYNNDTKEWECKKSSEYNYDEISKILLEQKKSYSNFLLPQWGVYISAYARYELLQMVHKIGNDVCYCDTDSIKMINYDEHKHIIDEYNENKKQEFIKIADEYNYKIPKKPNGELSYIGTFDKEEQAQKFKTLGAKRYMGVYKGKYKITVAGLSKEDGKNFIEKQQNPFEFFTNNMHIDKEYSGRLTHTYIDDEIKTHLKDYQGNIQNITVKSCVHLEKSDYNMSLADDFMRLICTTQFDNNRNINASANPLFATNFIEKSGIY